MFSSKCEYFDVVVIGCGPAGSVVAANLAKQGISVLTLERHQFPRYHIGESLTGYVGDFIREIGLEEEMERLKFPKKQGIKIIGKEAKNTIFIPTKSPTWHVRRDEFDNLLLNYAIKSGVTHRYGSVKKVFSDRTKVTGIGYKPYGSNTDLLKYIRCKIVVDASGHTTVLSKNRIAGPKQNDSFWRRHVVFTRLKYPFSNDPEIEDSTNIFYSDPNTWAWLMPIAEDVVSVGVAVSENILNKYAETFEDLLHWGLNNVSVGLASKVKGCEIAEEIRVVSIFSYRVEPFTGEGWICVGDSHHSQDPIIPLGVSFAIIEAKAASAAIAKAIETNNHSEAFAEYVQFSDNGQNRAADLIRYFWNFLPFLNYQVRGNLRKDIIRLMDGDCFTKHELAAMTTMRQSLDKLLPHQISSIRAREVANRIRFSNLDGIDAVYLADNNPNIKLFFILSDNSPDLLEAMSDFEKTLRSDFGHKNLDISHYLPGEELPVFNEEVAIFDKKKKS